MQENTLEPSKAVAWTTILCVAFVQGPAGEALDLFIGGGGAQAWVLTVGGLHASRPRGAPRAAALLDDELQALAASGDAALLQVRFTMGTSLYLVPSIH